MWRTTSKIPYARSVRLLVVASASVLPEPVILAKLGNEMVENKDASGDLPCPLVEEIVRLLNYDMNNPLQRASSKF